MHQLNDFKNLYCQPTVPDDLEFIIKSSIRRNNIKKIITRSILSFAAAVVIFAGTLNVSPSFASALSDVPILGSMVKIMTFSMSIESNGLVEASIDTPVIQGLDNKELETLLNEKYMTESTKLYDSFMEEMGEIIEMGGHMGIDTGYVVETDTEDLLSIGRYYVNTVGSSSTTFQYDTIDKKNGLLITLPSLFVDDNYIDVISNYLIETMKEKMAADEDLVYWVEDDGFYVFETIEPEQSFFINPQNKLVISFDKYDIAPGYMGMQTFQIPTEIIEELLINNNYIK